MATVPQLTADLSCILTLEDTRNGTNGKAQHQHKIKIPVVTTKSLQNRNKNVHPQQNGILGSDNKKKAMHDWAGNKGPAVHMHASKHTSPAEYLRMQSMRSAALVAAKSGGSAAGTLTEDDLMHTFMTIGQPNDKADARKQQKKAAETVAKKDAKPQDKEAQTKNEKSRVQTSDSDSGQSDCVGCGSRSQSDPDLIDRGPVAPFQYIQKMPYGQKVGGHHPYWVDLMANNNDVAGGDYDWLNDHSIGHVQLPNNANVGVIQPDPNTLFQPCGYGGGSALGHAFNFHNRDVLSMDNHASLLNGRVARTPCPPSVNKCDVRGAVNMGPSIAAPGVTVNPLTLNNHASNGGAHTLMSPLAGNHVEARRMHTAAANVSVASPNEHNLPYSRLLASERPEAKCGHELPEALVDFIIAYSRSNTAAHQQENAAAAHHQQQFDQSHRQAGPCFIAGRYQSQGKGVVRGGNDLSEEDSSDDHTNSVDCSPRRHASCSSTETKLNGVGGSNDSEWPGGAALAVNVCANISELRERAKNVAISPQLLPSPETDPGGCASSCGCAACANADSSSSSSGYGCSVDSSPLSAASIGTSIVNGPAPLPKQKSNRTNGNSQYTLADNGGAAQWSGQGAKRRLRALIADGSLAEAWAWMCKCSQGCPGAMYYCDEDGDSLLHIVVWHQDLARAYAIVEMMRKDHARPKAGNGRAAAGVNAGRLPWDTLNKMHETPLMLSVEKRCAELTAYLLECGADPNTHSKRAQMDTPLHYAASRGMAEMVALLCQTGRVRVDEMDAAGQTALICCVRHHGVIEEESQCLVNNKPALRTLLAHGADATLPDLATGQTALHLAVHRIDPQLVEIFSQYLTPSKMRQLSVTRDSGGLTPMERLGLICDTTPATSEAERMLRDKMGLALEACLTDNEA